MRQDDLIYHDPEFVDFYDLENGGGQDFDVCIDLAKSAGSVLDLGCGTGALAAMIANGRRVVGVDPATAMLDIARERDGGGNVRWIEGDARTLRLGETFDLVLMTGHAFQCFLTDADMLAALKTIAAHLAPGGTFIFDSRNPGWEQWREWVPARSARIVTHPLYGDVRAWNDVDYDTATGIATYQTFYRIEATAKTLNATSRIRFITDDRLAGLLADSGLAVKRWIGRWAGSDYEASSKEIIAYGTLAQDQS